MYDWTNFKFKFRLRFRCFASLNVKESSVSTPRVMATFWLEGLDFLKDTPNQVSQQPPLGPMTFTVEYQSGDDVGHIENWCKVFGNPHDT